MSEAAHPADSFESHMRTARWRGGFAMAALGCTAALRLAAVGIALWQNSLITQTQRAHAGDGDVPLAALQLSDSLTESVSMGGIVLLVVTATLFILWLRSMILLARGLGASELQWKVSDAFAAFVVPVQSFVRPYEVVRDVSAALDPETVPAPTAQAIPDQGPAYRGVELREPPPPRPIPNAYLGAWWAAFWVGNVMGRVAMATDHERGLEALYSRNAMWSVANGIQFVSAALAVLVVRSVSARLAERYRRVRHNTPAALKAAGIELLAA